MWPFSLHFLTFIDNLLIAILTWLMWRGHISENNSENAQKLQSKLSLKVSSITRLLILKTWVGLTRRCGMVAVRPEAFYYYKYQVMFTVWSGLKMSLLKECRWFVWVHVELHKSSYFSSLETLLPICKYLLNSLSSVEKKSNWSLSWDINPMNYTSKTAA